MNLEFRISNLESGVLALKIPGVLGFTDPANFCYIVGASSDSNIRRITLAAKESPTVLWQAMKMSLCIPTALS